MSAMTREGDPEPFIEAGEPEAERWSRSGEIPIKILDWGGPSATKILFLHGGGLTAHTWDLVISQIRDRYRCFAVDLRGHGDSGWSSDGTYPFDKHVSDIEAVVADLGLDRFVLVGMSLGGIVALTYGGRHPERLLTFTLVDVGPEGRSMGGARIRAFREDSATELDSVDAFVERAMRFNPLRRPEILRRSLLHNLRQLPNGKWTWKYDPRTVGRAPLTDEQRAERAASLWAAVDKITCPALVMRGAKSDVLHDEDAEKLAKRFANGRWVRIDGAGHTIQGDRPRAFVKEFTKFLDETVPAEARG